MAVFLKVGPTRRGTKDKTGVRVTVMILRTRAYQDHPHIARQANQSGPPVVARSGEPAPGEKAA